MGMQKEEVRKTPEARRSKLQIVHPLDLPRGSPSHHRTKADGQSPSKPVRPPAPERNPAEQDSYANLGEARMNLMPSKPNRLHRNSSSSSSRGSPPLKTREEGPYAVSSVTVSSQKSILDFITATYGEKDVSPNSKIYETTLDMETRRQTIPQGLEDTYGAVVTANHQALSRMLDQLHDHKWVPEELESLECCPSLRWRDFSIVSNEATLEAGERVFLQALHKESGGTEVTLVLSPHPMHLSSRFHFPFSLAPVRQFSDLVSVRLGDDVGGNVGGNNPSSRCIWVLPRMEVYPMLEFARHTSTNAGQDFERTVVLTMVQLVTALKHLQGQGYEDVPGTLEGFLVARQEERDRGKPRLLLLQDNPMSLTLTLTAEGRVSLCQAALEVLTRFLDDDDLEGDREGDPDGKATRTSSLLEKVRTVLGLERADSLTKAKALLDLFLFGPQLQPQQSSNLSLQMLQQWLDLERATVLNQLVQGGKGCTLGVLLEYQLLFLVRTNPRSILEALAS